MRIWVVRDRIRTLDPHVISPTLRHSLGTHVFAVTDWQTWIDKRPTSVTDGQGVRATNWPKWTSGFYLYIDRNKIWEHKGGSRNYRKGVETSQDFFFRRFDTESSKGGGGVMQPSNMGQNDFGKIFQQRRVSATPINLPMKHLLPLLALKFRHTSEFGSICTKYTKYPNMEAGYGHYRVIALSRYRLVHNAITRQRDNATTR